MKRFYKDVKSERRSDGFVVLLDGRTIRTPAKNALELPSSLLGDAIAAEWAAQFDEIDPASMPLTRHAYTAIDGVRRSAEQVVDEIGRFGETDLVCYRADGPRSLVAKQAEAWDPLLVWLQEEHGAALAKTSGIMPIQQPPEALTVLKKTLKKHNAFELTALHTIVSISGSLVIGLAASAGHLDASSAWQVSRVDHDFQAAVWGVDREAAAEAARARSNLNAAVQFLELARAQ